MAFTEQLRDLQMFSLYRHRSQHGVINQVKFLPAIINSLDDEAKRWADSVHIFAHDLLDYSSLSSIVEATEPD